MRDVLSELTRPSEIVVDRLTDEETDGLLVLIELPIPGLVLIVGRRFDHETDGRWVLTLMELPMRAVLLESIRTVELRLIDVDPVELLPIEMPDEGLREIDESDGRDIVIRPDPEPFGLMLDEIVPERLGVGRLTVILFELPRLGTDRLDVARLGLLLIDIELDRLGAGDLLIDDLLEMLRLETDRLGLRLTDIELDRLGAGARLSDDMFELLRVGAGALLGGAGLAACAGWLEPPELELFRELLAARTESAAKENRRMHRINRILRICLRRNRNTRNLELSLYASMIASFLQQQFIKRASAPCSTCNRRQLGLW